MEVQENHVFNLMDTNGRRKDVINALNIYLSILSEMYENNPTATWSAFPNSLEQYNFYKKAIEASPDVLSIHPKFDAFDQKYKNEILNYNNGNKKPLIYALNQNISDKKSLDVDIESRARHYSSNLCKLGFVFENRKISKCGESFLGKHFEKDKLENIFPLTNTNIVIFRQLLKLKVFSSPSKDGSRVFYSPFKMGLYLLLTRNSMSEDDFRTIVQSISPYHKTDPDELIEKYFKEGQLAIISIPYPNNFKNYDLLPFEVFGEYFKNFKSSKVESIYYDFYKALYEFRVHKNNKTLNSLLNIIEGPSKEKIKKAFGYGKPVFDLSTFGSSITKETFLELNKNNNLILQSDFNFNIYKRYIQSKYTDAAREYSDTTKRMLSATGIFKFKKGLTSLAYKEIFKEIFNLQSLKSQIFGTCTNNEFESFEGQNKDDCYYFCNHSLCEILNINNKEVDAILNKVKDDYGTDISGLANAVEKKTSNSFIQHIKEKYPREKILTILPMFSDRTNDQAIKEYVNPEATVPTIYEFIIAIAWFYISDETIDVYNSLNLTLNADFEPILFAAGGDGDIIIKENEQVTMLEVTLMNKYAQRQGELEPVLRHSANLKAKYNTLKTITFFVADELDFNTTNTWRYLYNSEQMPTISSDLVSKIIIMSFTNSEICSFIQRKITSNKIIKTTETSFMNDAPQAGWREKIVNSLLS